jgi:hypothetical protein
MNTIQDFTAKLDKINWTAYDFATKTITSWDGFKLSYDVELNASASLRLPVFQVVIKLWYKDNHIMTWGCDSYESQDFFGRWFVMVKAKAFLVENEREKVDRLTAKEIFNKL